jgi:hypothetical protein
MLNIRALISVVIDLFAVLYLFLMCVCVALPVNLFAHQDGKRVMLTTLTSSDLKAVEESDIDANFTTSGVLDVNGVGSSPQELIQQATKPFVGPMDKDMVGMLIMPHGADPISEYTCPRLLEYAFPTLYPRGRGGYDFRIGVGSNSGPSVRRRRVTLDAYIKRCLNLHDNRFRRHFSWMYIIANIQQRRLVLMRASTRARTTAFIRSAEDIQHVTSEMVLLFLSSTAHV